MMKKYRILFFIVFTLILTWIGGTVYFNKEFSNILPQGVLIVLKIIFIPSIIAPFFVASVMQYSINKKKRLITLLRKFLPRRTKFHWYIIAVVTPILVYLLASIIDLYHAHIF